jgi:hypothetical protein
MMQAWLGLNQLILELSSLVMELFITLILNDHVVHDHTNSRHLAHDFVALICSRVQNNSPP